ncbi:hypothetical protein BJ170DRAFT_287686 [Xylariales sp. AK1849]|nr:hypothetical protein BJ170DRAFT_287686 [Xylariales sp. AK1849]
MAVTSSSKPLLESDNEGYTRLHITPFDAELLNIVIPAAVRPNARNISYHTIETFPEKRYGFVDIPTMEADKLKKKLNGAVLKGSKLRVQQARPETIPVPTGAEGDGVNEEGTRKEEKRGRDKNKESKKRKRGGPEVVEGVELEDRKVKRGWTVSEGEMIKEKRKDKSKKSKDKENTDKKDKKKEKREMKSKYTEGPECLFKQKLPDVPVAKVDEGDDGQRRKKRKSDRQVTVHEFEKSTKVPSFLKVVAATSSSAPLTFEDGKGWVDDNGNVVETAKSKRPASMPKSNILKKEASKPAPALVDDDETSSSGSSSESEDDENDEEESSSEDEVVQTKVEAPSKKLKVDTQAIGSPISALKLDSSRPKSSSSATSLTIKIPPITPAGTKVHPLEALYKRPNGSESTPNGASTSQAQPFSFFENDDDIEEDGDTSTAPPVQNPMTPFTKQDFDFRGVRSAAPTPDTAHPSRSYNLWPRSGSADDALIEEDDEDEDEQGEDDTAMTGIAEPVTNGDGDGTKQETSEFQKWFWEHRGDLNRSWKKRRKTASKEKRNRENRARAARAI